MTDLANSTFVNYDFEILIRRSFSETWELLTTDIDAWWMKEFRTIENSKLSLDLEAGGQLLERNGQGSSLEWYRVQMVQPGQSLHLLGYMAPDWGGPTSSMLKLSVEQRDKDSALVVSEALLGKVTEKSANAAEAGWKTLFHDGFKLFAEK